MKQVPALAIFVQGFFVGVVGDSSVRYLHVHVRVYVVRHVKEVPKPSPLSSPLLRRNAAQLQGGKPVSCREERSGS